MFMTDKQKLRQKEYAEKLLAIYGEESGLGNFEKTMEVARCCIWQASLAHTPYFDAPIVSHRKGIVGVFVLFFKRLTRKATRFLIIPYIEKNYQFQEKTLESLNYITAYLELMKKHMDKQSRDVKIQD